MNYVGISSLIGHIKKMKIDQGVRDHLKETTLMYMHKKWLDKEMKLLHGPLIVNLLSVKIKYQLTTLFMMLDRMVNAY